MKVSKLKMVPWHYALILLIFIVGLIGGVLSENKFFSDSTFATDLRLRRNEICCAHQRVNSFRIWNRDVDLPGFAPMSRFDRPKYERKQEDRVVHAYPAWHTAFFYFYGWLPELMCIALMALIFGFCFKFSVDEIFRLSRKNASQGRAVAAFALAMISFHAAQCFFLLNYGILLLALLFMLCRMVDADRPYLSGICWAIMMIKPQVGLLFFWPLFWRMKYKTIITAVAICICATSITAIIVKENPVDLILQIAEIGRPYGSYILVDRILKPLIGDFAPFVWMGGVFIFAGILSYLTRGSSFIQMCVPITVLIPIWTYSQGHDLVILAPWYIMVAIKFIEGGAYSKMFRGCVGWFVFATLFMWIWSLLMGAKIFDPTGMGWLYTIIRLANDGCILAMAWIYVYDLFMKNSEKRISMSAGVYYS